MKRKHVIMQHLTATFFISICFMSISCNDHPKKKISEADIKADTTTQLTATAPASTAIMPAQQDSEKDTLNEVMDARYIRLNGKLERYFSRKEFSSVLGEPDSAKLLSEEEPCTNNFVEADGSVDPQAKYLFKNGSKYENVKNKVAIEEISFAHGDFITYRGVTLNGQTTLTDLQKLFPNAVKNVGMMDVYGEGQLQVIQLREDKNNVSDGHINIFLKNGRLYIMHWWFPC